MKRRVVEKRLARWGEMKVMQERTVVRYVVEEFSEHDGCWHTMRYRKSINGDEDDEEEIYRRHPNTTYGETRMPD